MNEVWPTHLSLDLTLDFTARRMRGTNELTLAYAEGPAPAHLDLDTSELSIARVVDPASGRDLRFTLGEPVPFLGRRLRIDLGGSKPAKLRVDYETSPGASALQWLSPQQTSSGRLPFLFTQSQAVHARSWIPCADSPGTRITYDAVVHAPPGIRVVMSAEHLTDEPAQGIFRFRMTQAIPPYLMALAAGELGFEPLGARTGVYAEPAVLARAASEFRDVEKMVEAAEALYGPYAWGRWDTIVLPPSFPFGGMENPRLTFATPTIIAGDRSLVDVMAHELAHSWSGNLVTNATWSDFWLNEGFTTYIENRIVERLYGKDLAEMQVLLQIRQLRQTAAERGGRAGRHAARPGAHRQESRRGRRRRLREGLELPARAREALWPRAARHFPARILRRQCVSQHDHRPLSRVAACRALRGPARSLGRAARRGVGLRPRHPRQSRPTALAALRRHAGCRLCLRELRLD